MEDSTKVNVHIMANLEHGYYYCYDNIVKHYMLEIGNVKEVTLTLNFLLYCL